MKFQLVLVGKTNKTYLEDGISLYCERIKKFFPFDVIVLKDIRNSKKLSTKELMEKEGELLIKQLDKFKNVVLLSEKGRQLDSIGFSKFVSGQIDGGFQQLTFVVGGAYGFSDMILNTYKNKLSLSKMTFSHQMVRLFFVEQLYRALSIRKGLPYHHE